MRQRYAMAYTLPHSLCVRHRWNEALCEVKILTNIFRQTDIEYLLRHSLPPVFYFLDFDGSHIMRHVFHLKNVESVLFTNRTHSFRRLTVQCAVPGEAVSRSDRASFACP